MPTYKHTLIIGQFIFISKIKKPARAGFFKKQNYSKKRTVTPLRTLLPKSLASQLVKRIHP